jgi:hypothetical protein
VKKSIRHAKVALDKWGENAPDPPHVINFTKNIKEVQELVKISGHMHHEVDCKHNLGVLYKSAVVLLVACWEAYIEDLVEGALTFMLKQAEDPSVLPPSLLESVSAGYSKMAVWEFANAGWRTVLEKNYQNVRDQMLGTFHSPKSFKIDQLYAKTIGLEKLSQSWTWQGMTAKAAIKKLNDLISLRGEIAHRVQSRSVRRHQVSEYIVFVFRLAAECSNAVGLFLIEHLDDCPWGPYHFDAEEED